MIQFIQEENSIFAVEQNVEKGGKFYDELIHAEMEGKVVNGFCEWFVTWQDDWQHPLMFSKKEDAEKYIKGNYFRHTPFVNGTITDIE